MTDFVESLGSGFLAHRLRRASEAILEATTHVLRTRGFNGPARSVSTLLLLRDHGPMGVTEIAHRLRLSHPMIIKLTRALAAEGLVAEAADPRDARRRLIALTDEGRVQTENAAAVGVGLVTAIEEGAGAELVRALDAFAVELAAAPLDERITAALAAVEQVQGRDR